MREAVALQRRGGGEAAVAVSAGEGFKAVVDAFVDQQGAALSETLPTALTDEGHLTAVHGAVRLQVSCLREAPAAHVTAKGAAS